MQAIILAGGTGSRLRPMTLGVNKHLLPIFNKPLFYYPLAVAILAEATKIILVVNPGDVGIFEIHASELSKYNIDLHIITQDESKGISHGLKVAQPLTVPDEGVLLLLGDNITFGKGVGTSLQSFGKYDDGFATCFVTEVRDPENFGIVTLEDGKPISIAEKPARPNSNLAAIGLYYFPNSAFARVDHLHPSIRGELEVTDLLTTYLEEGKLNSVTLSRGTAWLDAGTARSMLEASTFVEIIEERQGLLVGSPHEAALRTGLIDETDFMGLLRAEPNSDYYNKLRRLGPKEKLQTT